MKIVQMKAENVKRLQAVEITPDAEGNMVIIGGQNGAGKSSVLDSIEMALSGKSSIPSVPIHKGKKKARVVLELSDEGIVVERTFSSKGSQLVVKSAKGAKFPSPQRMLDDLRGAIGFDPLDFLRADPAQQVKQLKELSGLDLDSLEAQYDAAYKERTAQTRELKSATALVDGTAFHKDAPDAEVSVRELSEELERKQEVNRQNEEQRVALDDVRDGIASKAVQIRVKRRELEALEKDAADLVVEEQKTSEVVDALVDENVDEVREKLRTADDRNSKVRDNRKREELAVNVCRLTGVVEVLNAEVEELKARKAEMIAASKMPVEGLAVEDGRVQFNGLPLDQASQAEQLKVAVAIGLAANPKLRILLIRDGSLLDDKNLGLMREMAEKADAQIWLERVGKGKEVSVVIEDGMVEDA